MMKRLSIIRHAKSTHPNVGSDYGRTINERGVSDAKLIGEYLVAQDYKFDLVLCSSAVRAKQTLNQLNTLLNLDDDLIIHLDDLYLASRSTICRIVEACDDRLQHVAMVGHNPGVTSVCNFYTGDNLENLPTCGVYSISFQVDNWQTLGQDVGKQEDVVTPNMLKQ